MHDNTNGIFCEKYQRVQVHIDIQFNVTNEKIFLSHIFLKDVGKNILTYI